MVVNNIHRKIVDWYSSLICWKRIVIVAGNIVSNINIDERGQKQEQVT